MSTFANAAVEWLEDNFEALSRDRENHVYTRPIYEVFDVHFNDDACQMCSECYAASDAHVCEWDRKIVHHGALLWTIRDDDTVVL